MDDNQTWRLLAACQDADPDLFFPVGQEYAPARVAAPDACAICDACPVRQACLEYALVHEREHGVFAATTPAERRNMRRSNYRHQHDPRDPAA